MEGRGSPPDLPPGRAPLRGAERWCMTSGHWVVVPTSHSLQGYPPGRPGSGETKGHFKTHHLLLPASPLLDPRPLQDVNPGAGREPELREGITDPAPSMATDGALGHRVWRSHQPISAQSPCHFPVPYSLDQPLTSWGPTLVTTLHSRRKLFLPLLLLWLPRFGVEPLGFQD